MSAQTIQPMNITIPGIGIKAFLLTVAYFMPIREMVHAVVFLWLVDWILGVWKSLKANRKLTSYRFRKSITKITTYVLAIMSTFVLENTFLPDWSNLSNIVAGYVAFTELVSIYENMSEITGRKLMLELLTIIRRNFENFLKPKE